MAVRHDISQLREYLIPICAVRPLVALEELAGLNRDALSEILRRMELGPVPLLDECPKPLLNHLRHIRIVPGVLGVQRASSGEVFAQRKQSRHVARITGDTKSRMLHAVSDSSRIHITVPASPSDPRTRQLTPSGVTVHYTPALHPDDVCVIDGVRTTSPSRTLVDLAEVLSRDELRACFRRARARGLLDREALVAARERVEWRPSLQMFDDVMGEFLG